MNNNLSRIPDANDPLDALLRDADEYVADDGFTSRVVAALPRRRRRSWVRLAVLSAALLSGAAIAAWQLPSTSELLGSLPRSIRAVNWQTFSIWLPVCAALASLSWCVFAMVSEEE